MHTDVSIVIINYNTAALTLACLQSVFHQTTGVDFEVVLVDNASTECDPLIFKERFPAIHLIRSAVNTGFAGGNNLGLAQAKGRYVLLLNSDMELRSNVIKDVFDFMEKTPSAGVCSIRLLHPDGRHQSVAQRFPSVKYKLAELLRLQKLLGKKRGGRLLLGAFFNHRETVKADWVWGAFFMFRKSMLFELPGQKLNDDYFMYGEDMQWCMDFQKRGWETWYLGSAEAIHHMGGSSADKDRLMTKSNSHFMKKNYRPITRHLISLLDSCLRR